MPTKHGVTQETFDKVERAKREWEATADSLSELICLLDDAGRIMRGNRAVEGWGLGKVQTLAGLPFHQLLHPRCASSTCALHSFLARATGGAALDHLQKMEFYDETLQRYLFIRVQPVREGRNVTPRTRVIVVQDITERKRVEQELRGYTFRLQTMNEIGQAILAARSPEEIGQAALSRIQRLLPDVRWASIALTEPATGQLLVLAASAKDGDPLPPIGKPVQPGIARQCLPLIADGEIIGRMDLGGPAAGALSEEHQSIAAEVANLLAVAIRQARLNRQLEQANRELREAVQARDEMIQNVSHELRTPLTIIQGYADLLSDDGLGALSDEQLDAVVAIGSHSRRLQSMVEKLLTLQALTRPNAASLHRMDLAEIISQSIADWHVRFQEAGIGLQLALEPGPTEVTADPELLAQLIYNLLDNALRFSKAGSWVTVRAYHEGSEQIMAVADQGIGIPADKLERIFERFYQVSGGLNRNYGGMGIGLALCRRIAELHGGRIWAESRGPGAGSAFYVALPACNL